MIFTMEKLLERANEKARQKKIKPNPDIFRSHRDLAEKELLDSGYDKRYPKLFNDIANYIALWRMGFADTGLILMGNTGCGKTEAAVRLSAMLRIEFVTVSDLISSFGSSGYYSMVKQPDLMGNPSDLIIDEVGAEPRPFRYYGTQYNVIADVIQERYNAFKFYGARTIITTNLGFDQIDDAYGDRIESRCWEMFQLKQYSCKDFRK